MVCVLFACRPHRHPIPWNRLIVLHEVDVNASLFHIFFVVGFHEIATGITMNSRLNNTEALDAAYIFLNFTSGMSPCLM